MVMWQLSADQLATLTAEAAMQRGFFAVQLVFATNCCGRQGKLGLTGGREVKGQLWLGEYWRWPSLHEHALHCVQTEGSTALPSNRDVEREGDQMWRDDRGDVVLLVVNSTDDC